VLSLPRGENVGNSPGAAGLEEQSHKSARRFLNPHETRLVARAEAAAYMARRRAKSRDATDWSEGRRVRGPPVLPRHVQGRVVCQLAEANGGGREQEGAGTDANDRAQHRAIDDQSNEDGCDDKRPTDPSEPRDAKTVVKPEEERSNCDRDAGHHQIRAAKLDDN
jgi:hypothetical protein